MNYRAYFIANPVNPGVGAIPLPKKRPAAVRLATYGFLAGLIFLLSFLVFSLVEAPQFPDGSRSADHSASDVIRSFIDRGGVPK